MRRRIRRRSIRRRPLRRSRVSIGVRRIRRSRYGLRRLRRFRRGYRRRGSLARVRRASFSKRSTGFRGNSYFRKMVRLDTVAAKSFPFDDASATPRSRCLFWPLGTLTVARPGCDEVAYTATTGSITAPAEVATSGSLSTVNGDLTAFINVNLSDIIPATLSDFGTYGQYRIRRMRYTLIDRAALPVSTVNGVVTNNFSVNNAEVSLVNTSRIGEVVGFYGFDSLSGVPTILDVPSGQLSQLRNRRNVCRTKHFMSGRRQSLSLSVNCTEDYVKRYDDDFNAMSVYSFTPNVLNADPVYAFNNVSLASDSHGLGFRRRPFRWTRLYATYKSGGVLYTLLNDIKIAHGIEVIVRNNTYTPSNPPCFQAILTVTLEFRNYRTTYNTSGRNAQLMYPWTSTMYGPTLRS